jgi:hypothetical protein
LELNVLNDFIEFYIGYFIRDLAGARIPMPAPAVGETEFTDFDR